MLELIRSQPCLDRVNAMTTSDIPRPRRHLIAAGKLYPGAWRQFDQFRAGRGKELPQWPDWCFVPMAAAYAVVSGGGDNRILPHMIGDVARLVAVASWRVTQGIYRFDPALYCALIETPIGGDLPADVLYRMPEWCVYIETPGLSWMDTTLHGFFAHLEWDVGTARTELRLLLDSEADLTPIPVHIGRWPLAEAVARALDVSRVHAAGLGIPVPDGATNTLTDTVAPLVSLLLYLCADDAEIGDGRARPAHPTPTRTKQGWRLFPADKPTAWEVGVRLGAALRRAYHAAETGQTDTLPETDRARPRAHIRRAHWHIFLAGAGRTERRLKWLPPIPVNVDDIGGLPSTVRPIK